MTGFGEDAQGASDATDESPANPVPALHDAGLAELMCLVAWLRARGVASEGAASEYRLRLAPSEALDEFVHEILSGAGFIVSHRSARKRARSRLVFTDYPGELEDWMLAPVLGSPADVLLHAEL